MAAQQHDADPTDGERRFHYTMMAWLPTFFSDTLSLSLTQAAQVCCLPIPPVPCTILCDGCADGLDLPRAMVPT